MKLDEYTFAVIAWSLVLGPLAISLITWNFWWLTLWVVTGLIFGLA